MLGKIRFKTKEKVLNEIDLKEVKLSLIDPDPNQPRKVFNQQKLLELAESVRVKGLIQPIIIRKGKYGRYIIIAGERRYRAARLLRLDSIPAIIRNYSENDHGLISLIENIQRENLNPVEEAEALQRLKERQEITQDDLAKIVGKSKSTISETLSINKLPDEIKNEVRRAEFAELFSKRVLLEISKQDNPDEAKQLFNKIKTGEIELSQVRNITRKKKSGTEKQNKLNIQPIAVVDQHLFAIKEIANNNPAVLTTIRELLYETLKSI